MAKSRNRVNKGGNKKHANVSAHRTKSLKARKEKAQKEFMEMLKNVQDKKATEQAEKDANIVGSEEIGDIGEIELDTVSEPEQLPGEIEFITKPE